MLRSRLGIRSRDRVGVRRALGMADLSEHPVICRGGSGGADDFPSEVMVENDRATRTRQACAPVECSARASLRERARESIEFQSRRRVEIIARRCDHTRESWCDLRDLTGSQVSKLGDRRAHRCGKCGARQPAPRCSGSRLSRVDRELRRRQAIVDEARDEVRRESDLAWSAKRRTTGE